MQKVIEKIYEEVKERCMKTTNTFGIGAWDHHILAVYQIATKYHNFYNADYNIVALASLLHDVASVTNKDFVENHHIIGAEIAGELLKQHDLPNKQIELIKLCILNHRGSVLQEKTTPEEICIADADAMAHFYNIPSLLSLAYAEKHMSIDEGSEFVYNKLERSYNKLSNQGKVLIEPYHDAAKLLLKTK